MFQPELIRGGKSQELPLVENFKKNILDESEIREEKIFSKGEILGIIEQVAKEEGIKVEFLELSSERVDKEDNLIVLSVSVKKSRSQGEGWRSIEYEYMIKGNHSGAGFSTTSFISRMYNLNNEEDCDLVGGIVAEYENGKWTLTPKKISYSVARNIKILDED